MSVIKKVIEIKVKRETNSGKFLTSGIMVIRSDNISQAETEEIAKKVNDSVNKNKVVIIAIPLDSEVKYFKV